MRDFPLALGRSLLIDLKAARKTDAVANRKPTRAFARLVPESRDVHVDNAGLPPTVSRPSWHGDSQPAFVETATVLAQLRLGCEFSDEADAVHRNNTVRL